MENSIVPVDTSVKKFLDLDELTKSVLVKYLINQGISFQEDSIMFELMSRSTTSLTVRIDNIFPSQKLVVKMYKPDYFIQITRHLLNDFENLTFLNISDINILDQTFQICLQEYYEEKEFGFNEDDLFKIGQMVANWRIASSKVNIFVNLIHYVFLQYFSKNFKLCCSESNASKEIELKNIELIHSNYSAYSDLYIREVNNSKLVSILIFFTPNER
jgi:hypothetical protein